jgi:murein DD-endopeptidase MepM/ murein hydrolase activator NlpD
MATYTIRSGDTLSGIAARYGLDEDYLARINGIANKNLIYAGHTLKLDEGGSSGSSGSSGASKVASTPTFAYDPYEESDSVKAAGKAASDADSVVANYNPFAYANDGLANDILTEYLNRGEFSYDLNGDALYQQYKDKYIKQGKLAMQDTMGQAAAMTGGYGNSYAAAAGNQAYQAHLENLNDIIPELQQMAYDKYVQEGQDLYNKYGLLQADRSQKYGEWEAGYNRALAERDYARGVYDSERSYDYGVWQTGYNNAWNQHRADVEDAQWQQSYDYQVGRDAVEDAQWKQTFDEGVRQFNENNKINLAQLELQKKNSSVSNKDNSSNTPPKEEDTPRVDPNSEAIKSFQSSVYPESHHDAIARKMYGTYGAYVALQIANSTQLSESEKIYLIQYYGITESDLQYLKDKGHDI